jgi:hypothetical protein
MWDGSIHLQPCNEANNNFQETSPLGAGLGAGQPVQQFGGPTRPFALTNFSRLYEILKRP